MSSYAPLILTGITDYDGIRALLGVAATDVSNDEIDLVPYLPYVEAQVTAVVTDYKTLTGVDVYYVKAGVQFWTAARLCQLLAGKAIAGTFAQSAGGLRLGDYEERGGASAIVKMDYRQKAEELAGQAAEALGSISTVTYPTPTPMLLAGPTRSGSAVPSSDVDWFSKIIPDVVEWSEDNE